MSVATEAAPKVQSRPTATASSKGVLAIAAVAAIAPLDLAVPRDGWTPIYVRPLLSVVIAISVWIIVVYRRRMARGLGSLELAVGLWIIATWISAALSDAPIAGAAGAIRLSAVGLLVVATRVAVVSGDDTRLVLRGLAVGVFAASLVGLAVLSVGHEVVGTEHFVGSIGRFGPYTRLTRPWSNANVAAMAIGASLPAVLVLGRRWRLVAAPIVMLALILTYSRGAAIAVLAGAVVVIAVRRSRSDTQRVVAVIAVGLAVAAATPAWGARLDPPDKAAWNGAAIDAPLQLELRADGGAARVSVSNLSTVTWSATGADRVELSASWVGDGQDWSWGEHRWALPQDLAPGESTEMAVAIEASIPDGTFDVSWDLIRGGRAHLLRSLGQATTSRGVVVESAVGPADVDPVRVVPRRDGLDRIEIWELAVREFIDAPLLGVGPTELGIAVADDLEPNQHFGGRHAHSLVLEPLATTGLLGAIPLFFVLAGGLALAARRARRDRDLAALAVLVGLVIAWAHGLADWALVYTSAAIPVAVLTGIAWTWRDALPQLEAATAGSGVVAGRPTAISEHGLAEVRRVGFERRGQRVVPPVEEPEE